MCIRDRFSNLSAPSPFSALPPVMICNASPKAISGRTSYIRVRLEFLRYPHLIRRLFNGGRFGPPWNFTSTSTWTWIGIIAIVLAGVLLLASGFASASEIAFFSLSPSDLNSIEEGKHPDVYKRQCLVCVGGFCPLSSV